MTNILDHNPLHRSQTPNVLGELVIVEGLIARQNYCDKGGSVIFLKFFFDTNISKVLIYWTITIRSSSKS